MSFTVFDFASLPVSRWRNGGGETREIACWPVGGEDFAWRASIAMIEQDGPFSIFPDIDRSITLLSGEGLALSSPDWETHTLSTPLQPFAFPGDIPIHAHLLGGTSQDFNIMTRRGCWQASVVSTSSLQELPASHGGLVYVVRGKWLISHTETHELTASQGCWWLPAIKSGQLQPLVTNSCLLWVNLLPER
ncbi:hutD family protein [Yersinia rochesterensis]|uniref:HutD family protein n=1 Tax=Yersinia rochesterensis TaxID=1604335 RepID=A0A386HE37_9GAMM|nr:HutD family protein [Yersinia rochesterensis]AJI86564.1 protein ves [Yersinia frederiksenii Y225]CNH46449.1 cold inducible protein Ves [Yersinia kristensenii]AIN17888.1 hutD family protein [Yersinia rochesterensis]AJJ35861.1 hutD family protein [Yersinia rochesterensis]AYD43866.1 HutD family protein [Yersinia rochesterensis]